MKTYQESMEIMTGWCVMLVDVGSSTCDVTAISADSQNSEYNGGHNYLGARIVDWLIYDWYLSVQKQKDAQFPQKYQYIRQKNPGIDNTLLLHCRKAKKEICTIHALSNIHFLDFANVKLTPDVLDDLICSKPVRTVLQNHLGLPYDICNEIGVKSWKQNFWDFMNNQKEVIAQKKIRISKINLTGSASMMPVVSKTIHEMFPDTQIVSEEDTSRTISNGLVMVGVCNEEEGVHREASVSDDGCHGRADQPESRRD